MNQPRITYDPHVFDAGTVDDAKWIILTPEESATTEHRWATETPYLATLISRCFSLSDKSLVLDYGCGIGRLAKELLAWHRCRLIGGRHQSQHAIHGRGLCRFRPLFRLLAGGA